MNYAISPADQAANRRRFMADQAAINSILAENEDCLTQFQEIASEIFASKTAGRQYTRKPSVALRLRAEGAPAMLCATPQWNRARKWVNCHTIVVELLVERAVTANGHTGTNLSVGLGIQIYPDVAPRVTQWGRGDFSSHVASLLAIATEFAADPLRVTRRSSGHCCICGRSLTDGASKARGIGPECIRSVPWGLFSKSVIDRLCMEAAQ